jgi:hypothetical protein
MHCLNMRSAGISVSAAAYCRQIDSTTAARSSAMLGPVCPWTAVPATTHINAATALANQAHFAAAENTGPRLPVCLLPHQIITTQPTRLARPHRAVGIYSPADVTLNTGQFAGPTPPHWLGDVSWLSIAWIDHQLARTISNPRQSNSTPCPGRSGAVANPSAKSSGCVRKRSSPKPWTSR